MRITVLAVASFVCVNFVAALVQAGGAEPVANVWDGIYSAKQAIRGKRVFDEKDCITCHSEDGSHGDDGIPPITGPYFMTRWDGESIGDIYAFIAENMPRTKPGSLMPEDIADVIAYLLKLNELPAGPAPLSAEAVMLKTVMFTETAPAR